MLAAAPLFPQLSQAESQGGCSLSGYFSQRGSCDPTVCTGRQGETTEMAGEPTVFIIDDEEHVRKSLALLMESVHLRTETYGSAREFLEACDPSRPGCMVLDVRMPGMSGLELLERLPEKGITLPVIVITCLLYTSPSPRDS